MTTDKYPPEVAKLLTYGFAESSGEWPDYVRELGLREDHIDALIRIATDTALEQADSETTEASAPSHAWRALGQLRAVSAVEPLLGVVERTRDDWQLAEIPVVIGMIGTAAIPTLAAWLADESRNTRVTYAVILALLEVAKRIPDKTVDIVPLLTRRLEKYKDNDFAVNAYLVEALCTLHAKGALPLITQVYLHQRADVSIIHWDEVLDALAAGA